MILTCPKTFSGWRQRFQRLGYNLKKLTPYDLRQHFIAMGLNALLPAIGTSYAYPSALSRTGHKQKADMVLWDLYILAQKSVDYVRGKGPRPQGWPSCLK